MEPRAGIPFGALESGLAFGPLSLELVRDIYSGYRSLNKNVTPTPHKVLHFLVSRPSRLGWRNQAHEIQAWDFIFTYDRDRPMSCSPNSTIA